MKANKIILIVALTMAAMSSVIVNAMTLAWQTDYQNYVVTGGASEKNVYTDTPWQIWTKAYIVSNEPMRINTQFSSTDHRVWLNQGQSTSTYSPETATTRLYIYNTVSDSGQLEIHHYD
jgi:hypothetical protein